MKKVILSINALKAMNFLLETVLGNRHSVILVKDVMEGMQVLKNRTAIDTVFIDIDYNTAENLEFIQHIRSSRLYSDCSVIVLGTQKNIETHFVDLKEVECVFAKPFSPQKLIDYINDSSKQHVTM